MTIALFGLLAATALALLFSPLFLKRGRQRADLILDPYRRQLQELDKELARGGIEPREAQPIRLEIERRLIRESKALTESNPDILKVRAGPVSVVLLLILVGTAALLYGRIGQPSLPGNTAALERPGQRQVQPEIDQMEPLMAQLRARLEASPDDVEGWVLLGRSSLRLGLFEESANALARASRLLGGDADLYVQQGQALVGLHGGVITPAADLAFARALELQPAHPAPPIYVGYRLLQAGKVRAALEVWKKLVAQNPPDASWLAGLQADIERAEAIVAQQEGLLSSGGGPVFGAEQVEAIGGMRPEARQDLVESMVARLRKRLRANPDDLEGWLRLARSEEVLGNYGAAVEALDRAAGLTEDGAAKNDISARRERLARKASAK